MNGTSEVMRGSTYTSCAWLKKRQEILEERHHGTSAGNSHKHSGSHKPSTDHTDMAGHNLDTVDLGVFQFDHLAALP
jgi:hypothetical protein